MDRLIKTAWRAFWVGLGASAVLVSQSVLAPSPAPPADPAAAPLAAPPELRAPELRAPAALRRPSTDPVLSKVDPHCSIPWIARCS